MSATALLTGSRDDIREAASDPRIEAAEAALDRFVRTGAASDASEYARSCYAVVYELVFTHFPLESRASALDMAAVKVIDAGAAARVDSDAPGGGLVWSLAHELRDLAVAFGLKVPPIRAPRGTPGGAHGGGGRQSPSWGVRVLAREMFRVTSSNSALEHTQEVMGLSTAEVAALFGVRRQAVDQWRKNGMPPERAAHAERVADVATALYTELIPERIPQVVRTPARGLGGRTILQVLADPDGPERVRGYLARLYSFEGR
jgi:transcriptional regulator with XRE-family HTH domain